jgi:hypothetical protein
VKELTKEEAAELGLYFGKRAWDEYRNYELSGRMAREMVRLYIASHYPGGPVGDYHTEDD